jgi:hypothetical protein
MPTIKNKTHRVEQDLDFGFSVGTNRKSKLGTQVDQLELRRNDAEAARRRWHLRPNFSLSTDCFVGGDEFQVGWPLHDKLRAAVELELQHTAF